MSDRPIRVLFLCLGNICRSPLAEGVFRARVAERDLAERFEIDSAGTSAYHAGEPPDRGSVRVAAERGIDIAAQRSRPLVEEDFETFDFIVAMDRRNLSRVEAYMADERAFLAREFDPEATGSLDVPDPWGGGLNGFETVFDMLDRSVEGMVAHMLHHGPSD